MVTVDTSAWAVLLRHSYTSHAAYTKNVAQLQQERARGGALGGAG